jgi:hypothetical protein
MGKQKWLLFFSLALALAGCARMAPAAPAPGDYFTADEAWRALRAAGAPVERVTCVERVDAPGWLVFCSAWTADDRTVFDVFADPAGPGALVEERQRVDLVAPESEM